MKDNKQIAGVNLWMDSTVARIMTTAEPEKVIHEVNSTYESRERIEGEGADGVLLGAYRATNAEFTKHNREKNALRLFFKSIVACLGNYNTIEVDGISTLPAQFCNFVKEEDLLKGKDIHLKENLKTQ
jgi:hypothetical protein